MQNPNPLELDRAMRASLAKLERHPECALSVAGELVELGFSGKVACALVEGFLDAYGKRHAEVVEAADNRTKVGARGDSGHATARHAPVIAGTQNAEEQHMNITPEQLEAGIDRFKRAYAAMVRADYTARGYLKAGDVPTDYGLAGGVHGFTLEHEGGPKYVRILMAQGSSRSVRAFIRRSNGDLLYPAGYRGPVTKPSGIRGNIFAADHGMSAMGPYGMRTLR